jgi:hypothetical protein
MSRKLKIPRGSQGRQVVPCVRCEGEIQPYAGRAVAALNSVYAHKPGRCRDRAAQAQQVSAYARQTGFGWSCAHIEPSLDANPPRSCDVTGDDRAAYEAHMRGHGIRPLAEPEFMLLRGTSRIPKRPWRPKPLDAGQPIKWQAEAPAAAPFRAGLIWSAGPSPLTLWVIPDDDPGSPVLVALPDPDKPRWQPHPCEVRTGSEVRAMTRRASALAARRIVFAVIESMRESRDEEGRRSIENVLSWHSDPDCASAAGKRTAVSAQYDYARVMGILTGLKPDPSSPSALCRSCIYLDQPATDSATA